MEPSTSLQNRRSAKKAKTHKSIFSETEDNMSVRSEVSWLGSTARKKKERPPPKAYTKKRGVPAKPQLVVAGKEDADDEWSAEERHYDKQPTKKARKEPVQKKAKKPKVDSPRVTEDENSDDDLYYAAPARPRTDSDKENKKGKAPRRVPKEAEVKCVEETPSCQEKQPRNQKQRRGQPLRTIATPNTPLETDFGSIEKMRYQENEATPYLVVESPYMPTHVSLTGLEERLVDFPNLDDTDRAVELASPMSAVTHISSLKTPQTQRISEDLSENEEEDQISLFKINMPVLEDVKSGPRKRKRSVERKTAPSPISSLDRIEDMQVVEADEDEEEDPRVANLSKFGTSLLKTLQPRRLFKKNAQGSEKGKRKRKQESETEEEADQEEEEEENEEEEAVEQEEEADSDRADTTTPREEEDEDLGLPGHLGPDDTLPVHSLLQSFNKDIQRTMLVKRKRLEALTKGAVSSTQKKLSSIWYQQNEDRNEFIRTFQGIFLEEIANLERDVSKIRNIETDCMTFYQKQLDALRRCQTSHGTRFQRFKKMEMSFVNGFGNLEKEQQSGKAVVKDALKKEIQALHKRLVQEKQQEELANMRKSLHSMFF